MKLQDRVAAAISQFFGDNDTPEDAARAALNETITALYEAGKPEAADALRELAAS